MTGCRKSQGVDLSWDGRIFKEYTRYSNSIDEFEVYVQYRNLHSVHKWALGGRTLLLLLYDEDPIFDLSGSPNTLSGDCSDGLAGGLPRNDEGTEPLKAFTRGL